MSWDKQALLRAGSHEAMYAIMGLVQALIGDKPCGEGYVQHEGKSYRVSWSRHVCPLIW